MVLGRIPNGTLVAVSQEPELGGEDIRIQTQEMQGLVKKQNLKPLGAGERDRRSMVRTVMLKRERFTTLACDQLWSHRCTSRHSDIPSLLRCDSMDANSLDTSHSDVGSSQGGRYLCPLDHDLQVTSCTAPKDALASFVSTATTRTAMSHLTSFSNGHTLSSLPSHGTLVQGSPPRQRKRDRLRQLFRLRRADAHEVLHPRRSARNAAMTVLQLFPCFAD